jgi:FkbM family methyltransferase
MRLFRKLKWLFGTYLMPRHIATIATENGILSFDSRDRTLGRALNIEKEFESEMMKRTVNLLTESGDIGRQENRVLMDVGGYIGMSSIGFLNFDLFDTALIFEPNPNSFLLIKKNIKQNNFSNKITAFNVALSNENSELIMELSHKNFGDHRIRQKGDVQKGHYKEEDRKVISVKSLAFDMFIDKNPQINFSNISMVWMDIQGHESKFLQGAYNFLFEQKIPVVMEFWPYGILRSGATKGEFLTILNKLFTHFYTIDEIFPKLQEISSVEILFDECIKTASGGYNLAFVHKRV